MSRYPVEVVDGKVYVLAGLDDLIPGQDHNVIPSTR